MFTMTWNAQGTDCSSGSNSAFLMKEGNGNLQVEMERQDSSAEKLKHKGTKKSIFSGAIHVFYCLDTD